MSNDETQNVTPRSLQGDGVRRDEEALAAGDSGQRSGEDWQAVGKSPEKSPANEATGARKQPGPGGPEDLVRTAPAPLPHEVATGLSVTLNHPGSGSSGFTTEPGTSPTTGSPASRDETLPRGTRLGHFEIEYRLGSGGMGHVYRAVDRSLRRPVAVKILASSVRSAEREEDEEVERLLQEAVTQASLPHPNVVPIYYVGRQDGSPFLAMELVPGQTLQQRIAGGPQPFPEIVSIALQIVDALDFALGRDLIHGDIKPSNILVQDNLLAKLSDFGMARRASGDDKLPVGGTPNYLAPELLAGGKPTVQSDIYALGVTLYEMTFGERPIQLSGRTLQEWAESHRQATIQFPNPWPESVPEAWQGILRRMLAPSPAERHADYRALRQDLVSVMPSSRVAARWLPRIIAALVDYGLVLMTTVVILSVGWLVVRTIGGWLQIQDRSLPGLFGNGAPWYADLAMFLIEVVYYLSLFAPVALHTTMVAWARQSVGRELMHVHVVNRFGLPPSRRQMLVRGMVRTLPLWFFPLTLMSGISPWLPPVGGILLGLASLVTLISAAMMVVTPSGLALHDRWMKTRTVFGSGR